MHILKVENHNPGKAKEREGKTNFCFISSSWKDRTIPKLSTVSRPEPSSPSEPGRQRGWLSQMECRDGNLSLEVQREKFRRRETQPQSTIGSLLYTWDWWKWGLISNPRSTLALSRDIMFSECSPQNQCMGYRLLITKDPDHSLSFNVRMRAIVLLPRLLTMSHHTFSDTEQLFIVKLSYPSLSRI